MCWTLWSNLGGSQTTLEPYNWWALLITTTTGPYLMGWRPYSIYRGYLYNPYDLHPLVVVNLSCTAVTFFPFFITLVIIKIHRSARNVNAIQLLIPKLAMIWPTNYHKTITTMKEKKSHHQQSTSQEWISMVWWSSLREERMRHIGRQGLDSVGCDSWNLKPSTNSTPIPVYTPILGNTGDNCIGWCLK